MPKPVATTAGEDVCKGGKKVAERRGKEGEGGERRGEEERERDGVACLPH